MIPGGHTAERLGDLAWSSFGRVWRVAATYPETNLERAASDTGSAPDHLGPRQQASQALCLLDRQKAQRVVHHRGDAAMLSPEPVEEQREDQNPEEGLGLAAA